MRSLRATSSFREANRAHMGDVRDVESPAWNDYLAFFVIPSLPRNLAKRKGIIMRLWLDSQGYANSPLRMT